MDVSLEVSVELGRTSRKIKEILDCEILDNENRMKIMVSLHIIKLGTGKFY